MAKKTPFYSIHKKKNAKIAPFAGYEMPIHYEKGIIHEHLKVRESVGMFDLSHMGEIEIRGPKRLDLVQKIITNDTSQLDVGQVLYTPMCYPDGGIVDDLLVYRDQDLFYFVVNATNIEKDFQWLKDNITEGASIKNVSDKTALIAVQGPNAEPVVQKLVKDDISQVGYYHFIRTDIYGVPVLLSRTGYTGEDGFEIYFTDLDKAEDVWQKVESAGDEFGIEPIGLGARDTLRLEMRYPLYGNDIDETTNPLEAGLKWTIKFEKGDFIGKEALLKVKQEKIRRKLVAFVMKDNSIPRPGYEIFADSNLIGKVCSGTKSPSLNIGIGTGYIQRDFMKTGTAIEIKIRNVLHKAEIIKPPFYKNGSIKH
jgi:aminomethyltransferase